MKIGIVGPLESYEIVCRIIKKDFHNFEAVPMIYKDYTEATKLVSALQNSLDGIVFTGHLPFRYVSRYVQPTIPWEVIPQTQLSLVLALLKAVYLQQYHVENISLDSYNKGMILNAYREIGFSNQDVIIYTPPYQIHSVAYTQSLIDFHQKMYLSGQVSACITAVCAVHDKLVENGIPSVMLHITSESIALTLSKLRFRLLEIEKKNVPQYASLAVEYELSEEHLVYSQSILQFFELKNRIGELIYSFAQRLGAAVIEQYEGNYLLIVDKQVLEMEFEHFNRITIQDQILNVDIVEKVNVGIGIGHTPFDAKLNSELGLRRSRSVIGSGAFVVYPNQKILGPILPQFREIGNNLPNEYLNNVSQKTGVGIATLTKLDVVATQYGIQQTTSKELSQFTGIPTRTLNRILVRLEDCGFVTVLGKEAKTGIGRPGRVIELHLYAEKHNPKGEKDDRSI